MTTAELTPAAIKWLRKAGQEVSIWPTAGPYRQLTEHGYVFGPQEECRITRKGIVHLIELDDYEQSRHGGTSV